jgi:GNAT superfamily N-acetyltransferase
MSERSSSANVVHADHALAQRLELAEGVSNADFVDARSQAFPALGACWTQIAGALAMFDGVDSPCTQTFGLGLAEVTDAELDALESFFESRGSDVFHEVCSFVDASLLARLCDRGYRPIEQSTVLVRPLTADANASRKHYQRLRTRAIEPTEHELWGRVAAEGWADAAPGAAEFLRELARVNPYRSRAHFFRAELDGEAVAAGAICLCETVALLAGACTIPKYRGQGAQTALLDARLQFAAEQNCELAMIVTQPGSASQRNAERQSFRVAYTRTKWRRPRSVQ